MDRGRGAANTAAPSALRVEVASQGAPSREEPVPPPLILTPVVRPRDSEAAGGPSLRSAGPVGDVGRRRTVIDIAVQLIARAGNLALGVVVTLIIVRDLGSSAFGEWSTILAVSQIATSFGDLGLTQVAVSNAARDPDGPGEWLSALVGMRLVLSVPIFLIQLVIVVLIAPTSHVEIAGVLLSAVTLLGGLSALTAAFQLRVRNDLTMLVLTVNSVLWTGGVAIAGVFTHDVRTFAAVFLVVNILSALLTAALAVRTDQISIRGGVRLWRPMIGIGVALGGAGILVTLYVRLDQILVFKYSGSRQAGLYAAAYRILDQIQFLPSSVLTTLFPLIAAAYPADLPRVRNLIQTSWEYLSIASFGMLAFSIVEARPFMVLLFGQGFAAAAPALPILMGAFVSISFGYLSGSMVAVLHLQRRFLVYALVGLVVNVVLNLILLPRYGFKAAAWTTLATELTVMSSITFTVCRTLAMRPKLARLIRIALVALALGVILRVLRSVGFDVWAQAAVTCVVYVALLFGAGALRLSELRALRGG